MHKRTKAVSIPKEVKRKVYQRDNEKCIWCGRWVPEECACAHYIPRSQGGLGIEQNILTACQNCHERYDNSIRRARMKRTAKAYLTAEYGFFDDEELVYDKWKDVQWGIRE